MDIFDVSLPARPAWYTPDGALFEGNSGPEHGEAFSPGRLDFPMCITDGGNSTWHQGHYWRRRKSNIFAVEIVTRGNVRFIQNRQEYLVVPGQVFLLHLNGDHFYTTGPAGFVHKRFAGIVGPALDAAVRGTGLDRVDVVDVNDPGAVVSCMRRALRLLHDKPTGFEKALSSLAYELLNELVASSHARRSPPVQAAVDHVHRHVSEPMSNEELAAVAGVSTSYLIRTFTREVGTTPLRYHQGNRMQLARNLLRREGVSVKEAAQRVGFDDPLYFSRVFGKTFGMPPSGMRKS